MDRIGVDIGGTKIAVTVLDGAGHERVRRRVEYASRDYGAALDLLVHEVMEAQAGGNCSVGVGMPGLIDPQSGLVENAYNTPYNQRPLKNDLEQRLQREVRFANDANCFALSEAIDGAVDQGFGMSTAIHTAGTFPVFSPQCVVVRPSANPSPARTTLSGWPSWW